jgi:catechol 2,3-dioxygenase-like lactoylglutathione lyase family enzyme
MEHVAIYSRDPQALAEWYCRVLDLSVVRTLEKTGRPPIFFLRGEGGLDLELLPTKEKRVSRALSDPGLSHIGIVVDDHPAAVADLAARGIPVTDVRQTTQGWTIGYFQDPEGNTLEIVER